MFTFNTTPSIVVQAGASETAGSLLLPIIGKYALVVTDKGLLDTGIINPFLDSLAKAGVEYSIYSDVKADPPERNVVEALSVAERCAATGVIGIGGGSPLDVAKVTALLVGSGQDIRAAYGVGNAVGPRLPLALVPTTAGTGSEVTPIAILTTGESEKKGIVSPLLLPDIAILDADLTTQLPPMTTAATGIDAMVHAIEAFTSMSPSNNPISRGLARQALQLLSANIETATFQGSDRASRQKMLLGSLLAGQAFANSPVAAVHALAYPIGARYHVPHGLSNALVLPHVMRFNIDAVGEQYSLLAPEIFPDLVLLNAGSRVEELIVRIDALMRRLGLPARLRDVGIPASALDMLARDAMKQTRLLVNNPRPVLVSDALAIYQAAF
ncbi:iron-containing alcohol dehydrogenase [Paraburkholderia guartelaensis]|uniref:iron-containing alcohol dehydrogenase n=1 Tax=Paraburkholderia guartelaensis TaxID=2546446 RepID=UPI002AB61D2D|nr:iron-containing alcohol dehydrogenase [Paraburkholderia guartelaensis]